MYDVFWFIGNVFVPFLLLTFCFRMAYLIIGEIRKSLKNEQDGITDEVIPEGIIDAEKYLSWKKKEDLLDKWTHICFVLVWPAILYLMFTNTNQGGLFFLAHIAMVSFFSLLIAYCCSRFVMWLLFKAVGKR